MSIESSRTERIPGQPASDVPAPERPSAYSSEAEGADNTSYDNDVVAVPPDPKDAFDALQAAGRRWQTTPTELTWLWFFRAYADLVIALSPWPGKLTELLDVSKTDPDLEILRVYWREVDWRRQQTPDYKRKKCAYDRKNNQRPERKLQLAEAQRRYRANKRSER